MYLKTKITIINILNDHLEIFIYKTSAEFTTHDFLYWTFEQIESPFCTRSRGLCTSIYEDKFTGPVYLFRYI